jgi:hypothetical protein
MDMKKYADKNRVYIKSVRTRAGEPGVVFLSADNMISTFYLQSAGLIGFMIEKYGGERFAVFCRELRDGKQLEESLKSAYPTKVENIKELEDEWRKFIAENKY